MQQCEKMLLADFMSRREHVADLTLPGGYRSHDGGHLTGGWELAKTTLGEKLQGKF